MMQSSQLMLAMIINVIIYYELMHEKRLKMSKYLI